MSALTQLDNQVTLAEKAVADLKMRAQAISSGGTSTSGATTDGSGNNNVSPFDLGLGSGGPNPTDKLNSELGISTSSGGVDTRLPQDPKDFNVGPAGGGPLPDDGPTTSNGTTLTDDGKDLPKASVLIEKPNTKMRNLLIYVVLAFGAYMVFRKK